MVGSALRMTLALAACAAVAACGSSTSTSTNSAMSKSPSVMPGSRSPAVAKYVAAIAGTCTTTSAKLRAAPQFPVANFDPGHPDRSTLPKVAQYYERYTLPALEGALRAIRSQRPPQAAGTAAASFATHLAAYVATLRSQVAAAKADNPQNFANAVNSRVQVRQGLLTDIQALGVPACNGLFAGS